MRVNNKLHIYLRPNRGLVTRRQPVNLVKGIMLLFVAQGTRRMGSLEMMRKSQISDRQTGVLPCDVRECSAGILPKPQQVGGLGTYLGRVAYLGRHLVIVFSTAHYLAPAVVHSSPLVDQLTALSALSAYRI